MMKGVISVASHKHFKPAAIVAGLMLCTGAVLGQTTVTNTFTVGQNIPQGDPSGLANTQTLNFSSIPNFSSIVNLSVTLDISGGYNGGYYGYLVNNSGGFAILLNGSGKTAANSLGYADSGFNITLSETGNDIHLYQNYSNPGGGVLTDLMGASWEADGRNTDPATVVDTDPQNAPLSLFNGTSPSGTWTLFLANLDYGEQGELVSWGLVITAVPEPSSVGLAVLGLGIFLGTRYIVRRRA